MDCLLLNAASRAEKIRIFAKRNKQHATMALTSSSTMASSLDSLANIAAKSLLIVVPESPQGEPFVDNGENRNPATILRTIRKSLNLTQREFGILLSPNGVSPISPSVICQLESALQSVPSLVLQRAAAVRTATEHLGLYLAGLSTKSADVSGALKSLGPGCINMLDIYVAALPSLAADQIQIITEYLSIVTKRRQSSGGSRPGARGPYRKLSKLSDRTLLPTPAEGCLSMLPPAAVPPPIQPQLSGETTGPADSCSGRSSFSSNCSTPTSFCSTPGYDSNATSMRSESEYTSSYPGTPNGPISCKRPSETQQDILLALRQLQEQNAFLVQENKRLKAAMPGTSLMQTTSDGEVE